ncbi:MAG TPA: RNA-binding S4 domain-containing protein [Gammaproteobacteria bacterium]
MTAGISGAVKADGAEALRIDRWLWCARFYKTRSLAAQAVKGGHVRVNGQRAKPAREVRVGDILSITKDDLEREVTVAGIPSRRGPAPEAARCYVETAESIARGQEAAERRSIDRLLGRSPTPGRPDKRTRRLIRAQRSGEP